MSFTKVREFYRDRMNGLGYDEWQDGFNYENIPNTILDESYHIENGTISTALTGQTTHAFDYPITLRVFLKGYRNPAAAIDDAMARAEIILSDLLDPDVRLGLCIKDVFPDTIDVLPLDVSNDNALILQFVLTNKVFYDFSK